MIITGLPYKIIILNDTDLSTIKQIDLGDRYIFCGRYHKERDIIYLGAEYLIFEFDFKKLEITR